MLLRDERFDCCSDDVTLPELLHAEQRVLRCADKEPGFEADVQMLDCAADLS